MNTTRSRLNSLPRRRPVAPGLWFCFRLLPALTVCLLSCILLNASVARAADDVPGAGELMLHSPGLPPAPALMQRSAVQVSISGMVAVVTLEQSFRNTSEQWAEGVYTFPLPGEAAVRALEIRVGERRIVGEIRERHEAEAVYTAARDAGRKASLVAQQRPNLFSNRIANLAPGETIAVKLEFVQPVNYTAGVFSLRLPMTLTARYIPGRPLGDKPESTDPLPLPDYLGRFLWTDEVPDAPLLATLQHPRAGSDAAPLNPLTIAVELDPGMPLARVDSPYHEMRLRRDGSRYHLQLARGSSEMDRDFVLSWEPATGSRPQAALFTEKVAGEHYGLLLVVPPALAENLENRARELVFVVDTSGSMGGVPIQQLRESLVAALDGLRPGDSFNIIAFDHSYRTLFADAMPVDRLALKRARIFISELRAAGGTEMLPPLRRALASSPADDSRGRLRQVVFMTDGAVGNEQAIIDTIVAELGDSRLFTLGLGSAPNSWFLRKAAQLGRGRHLRIGDHAEISARVGLLLEYLAAPMLTDISVEWPQAVADAGGPVPDLYAGAPLLRLVRFNMPPQPGVIRVSGELAGLPWQQALALEAGDEVAASAPGVASLWARERIEQILDQRYQGRHEDSVRAEVLAVALPHRLLSPYTSFVAVEQQVSRPQGIPLRSVAVPGTRPRGQSPQAYAYPQTATTAAAKLFLACLLLFIALLFWVMRGPEADRVPDQPR
ncbi:marine proteobacterial sortase target protein [Haliea sp. E1-2-M8]|uniref:marine proteobacterial sortase target protein n=1 Tax=Haliea sp. E1-2-M8 TaxID=3064706 RepID=UPI002720A3A9|nr:marine proteobacterial sortase target protein [Haliea sp. E1-2-M8]MDO8862292.1 marine proteobacterial sortase target protein [Haliea sp. E1-2-M8]